MQKKVNLKQFIFSTKGSSSIVVVCSAVMILLTAALVTDIGYAAFERYKLSKGAKEVAKIGAAELIKNRETAVRMMKENAVQKVSSLSEMDIKISDNHREISIRLGKPFEYIFLGYAGIQSKELKEGVTARLSGISQYKGIRPFAVEKQNFRFDQDFILSNQKSERPNSIRIRELDLGNGDFESSILYGFRKNLKAGNGVYPLNEFSKEQTEQCIKQLLDKCKHKPRCTPENYQRDCSRIMILPVVGKLQDENQEIMKIEGFTAFFIKNTNTTKQGLVLEGRFLKYTVDSRINDAVPDFGLMGIELIQ
ncbi:MAG: hypothetical protein N2484_03275 [Clostridia bacterium]|nr:hypothetical protein [Clostridia bacterium]